MRNDHPMKAGTGVYLKSLARIHGKDILPTVKMPVVRKPRKKETTPRQPYNLQEAAFRRESIRYLRKKGCKVKRVENSITGNLGDSIPDLFVFCLRTKWGGFVESKSLSGGLRPGQMAFRDWCITCGVNHLVARTLHDYDIILDK